MANFEIWFRKNDFRCGQNVSISWLWAGGWIKYFKNYSKVKRPGISVNDKYKLFDEKSTLRNLRKHVKIQFSTTLKSFEYVIWADSK